MGVGAQRIEWRRHSPRQVMSTLGWYGTTAVIIVAGAWLLFGDEPEDLSSGGSNPLAGVPVIVTVIAAVGAALLGLLAIRGPSVAADHYALRVRPGVLRTMCLPWARIAEIAVGPAGPQQYLMIRSRPDGGSAGDQPTWFDRAVLRRAVRHGGSAPLARFDLAVPMADFVGSPDALLAALAAFAPDQVTVTGEPSG